MQLDPLWEASLSGLPFLHLRALCPTRCLQLHQSQLSLPLSFELSLLLLTEGQQQLQPVGVNAVQVVPELNGGQAEGMPSKIQYKTLFAAMQPVHVHTAWVVGGGKSRGLRASVGPHRCRM